MTPSIYVKGCQLTIQPVEWLSQVARSVASLSESRQVPSNFFLRSPVQPVQFTFRSLVSDLGQRTFALTRSLSLSNSLAQRAVERFAFWRFSFVVCCFLVSLFPFFTCSVHFSCFSSWTRSLMRPALGPWTILQSCALCFCALCFCALSRFQIALLWFRAVVPFVCGRGNAHQPTTHNMQTKQRRPAHSSQPTAALQPSHPTPPHPTHKLTIWTPRMDRMETASTLQYEKGGNI